MAIQNENYGTIDSVLVWLRSTQGRMSLVRDQYLAKEVSEWECCPAKLRLSPEVEAAWGLLAHERSLRTAPAY